jgi:peptidyl-prolyl cis-trans isomerase D
MLKVLREKSKIFLWIVAVAFIGFMVAVWGMDLRSSESRMAAGTVGEVNGQAIDARAYEDALRLLLDNYRDQNPNRDVSDDAQRQFADQAWQNIVQRTVLMQEARRRKIKVTDAEVVAYIRRNPLEQFLQNPSLQTDGRFDMQKYQQFLNDPRFDLTPLEDYVRSLLPLEKLRQEVAATVSVTDAEIRERFLADEEKVEATYLLIATRAFRDTSVAVTDEETQAYYAAHGDDFKRPEQAALSYVFFEKKASEQDDQEARTRADEILEEAKGGEDFADLAQFSSEDAGTAAKGGDLGFFGRGAMVKEFDDAAFAAEAGAIVGPVKTRFGYHVIKVEEKRRNAAGEEELRARHVLIKVEPSGETVSAIRDAAAEFAAAAAKEGFAKAAAAAGLTPSATTPFTKGDFVAGIGIFRRANVFAFASATGQTSPALDGPRGYYVFAVEQRIPPGVPPLDEIRDLVRQQIFTTRARDAARARADEALAAVRSGTSFDEAVARFGAEKRETGPVARTATLPAVGRETALIYAAFALDAGGIGGVVEQNAGFYVVRVDRKIPADESLLDSRKGDLRSAIFQEKMSARFSEFVQNLIETAKIEDHRDRQAET